MKIVINKLKEALWSEVEYVLLDMDGTIFDKHFDDYFWRQLVPSEYSSKNGMDIENAKEELFEKYRSLEGTLNWTDLDFWSTELGLDIPGMTAQIAHILKVNPYVEEFLKELRRYKKKVVLATNAHYKTIDIKMAKSALDKYFDFTVTSMDMGYPKENLQYWENAEKTIAFDKERTLFVDDMEQNVLTAKHYGIKYLAVKRDGAMQQYDDGEIELPTMDSFSDLMPNYGY
ncbi:MAG: HAD-IA family hydrolase [Candidatus Magnetoovum sp. WYHC-5]|nr:HAD-IA family hydrolase [Candidatus Magnetoovum sp. WYHC-5]